MTTQSNSWEEQFDKENWHAIEGPYGICACGPQKGGCHERLKHFISTVVIPQVREEERKAIEVEIDAMPRHQLELSLRNLDSGHEGIDTCLLYRKMKPQ